MGSDGAIEIKSVVASTHYANIKRQGLDPAYRWQCIGNCLFMGVEWLDFVSYCADFPIGKQLYTHRIHRDKLTEEFAQINERISQFEKLVYDTKKLILDSNYST